MNLLSIFLMGQQQGSGGSQYSGIIMMVLIIIVFYFFMIRPQLKKAKDQKNYREGIKKGDKVVTIGGIHGKIVEVNDKTFVIEVEGGTRLKIEKGAVSMEFTATLNQTT